VTELWIDGNQETRTKGRVESARVVTVRTPDTLDTLDTLDASSETVGDSEFGGIKGSSELRSFGITAWARDLIVRGMNIDILN
jgi:hypothetical protein